jgi:hypothetical protein
LRRNDHPLPTHAGHLGNALLATASHASLLTNFVGADHASLLAIIVAQLAHGLSKTVALH